MGLLWRGLIGRVPVVDQDLTYLEPENGLKHSFVVASTPHRQSGQVSTTSVLFALFILYVPYSPSRVSPSFNAIIITLSGIYIHMAMSSYLLPPVYAGSGSGRLSFASAVSSI